MRIRVDTKKIKSPDLRRVADHLIMEYVEITSYGRAWGNDAGDWIYFNKVLDLDKLRIQFDLSDHITIHENLDPKSGTERGFYDPKTEEGLMGLLK